MLIGYARISTTDQTVALQQDALTAAGCDKIFTDTASGSRIDRPGLTKALSYVLAELMIILGMIAASHCGQQFRQPHGVARPIAVMSVFARRHP